MFAAQLSEYAWFELWGPLCLAVIVFVSYLYIKKVLKPYNITPKQISRFFVAVGLFYIVKGSPFTIFANDFLFSAHMLGLATILFIVPPLLFLGIPAAFFRTFFWNHRLKYAFAILSHPWIIALLFNGGLSVYILPGVFNTVHASPWLSFVVQTFLFITASLMWWTIIAPVPEMNKLSDFIRIAYVFLTATLLMPIGFYLLLVTDPHYSVYVEAEQQVFSLLTMVYDQQLAGGILKAIQLSSFGIALYYLIVNWGRREEEREGEIDDENIRVVQGIVIHLQNKK